MGNMKDLVGMIPGMSKAVKNVDIDDNSFKSIEAIIQSMTQNKRDNKIQVYLMVVERKE